MLCQECPPFSLSSPHCPSDAPASCPALAEGAEAPSTLRGLFRAHRGRLLVTYGLFNVENLLRLAQPMVLGLAVGGLLRGSYRELGWLAAQHAVSLAICVCRRAYDTRVFTGIYSDLVTSLVLRQRAQAVEVSRVTARSALSRQLVDFFERDVTFLLHAAYSVAGALVMLAWCDWLLAPLCLGLLLVVGLLSRSYGGKTYLLNGRLHDELEREVDVIAAGRPAEVRDHYRRAARWRVRLSDLEAGNFGLMDACVLGLTAATLVRSCTLPGAGAGHITAVIGYVLMFVSAVLNLPLLVEQLCRLCDIARRLRIDPTGETP